MFIFLFPPPPRLLSRISDFKHWISDSYYCPTPQKNKMGLIVESSKKYDRFFENYRRSHCNRIYERNRDEYTNSIRTKYVRMKYSIMLSLSNNDLYVFSLSFFKK